MPDARHEMAEPSLIEILRVLSRHQVEFIVVGGMAAVIGGVPIVTRDVDVLRRRSALSRPSRAAGPPGTR